MALQGVFHPHAPRLSPWRARQGRLKAIQPPCAPQADAAAGRYARAENNPHCCDARLKAVTPRGAVTQPWRRYATRTRITVHGRIDFSSSGLARHSEPVRHLARVGPCFSDAAGAPVVARGLRIHSRLRRSCLCALRHAAGQEGVGFAVAGAVRPLLVALLCASGMKAAFPLPVESPCRAGTGFYLRQRFPCVSRFDRVAARRVILAPAMRQRSTMR